MNEERMNVAVRPVVRLVCGFPGVGKSHLCRKMGWHDSDSSQFSHRDGWPSNYIAHLKTLDGVAMVSTHKQVRDALSDAGMPFDLCYPSRELKHEYLARYKQRGNPATFVELLDRMWEEWITEMEQETRHASSFVLREGEFASDVISEPNAERLVDYPCSLCGATDFDDAANKCRGMIHCPGECDSREVFGDE